MSVDPRASQWREQLTSHPYEINASEFVRFRVESNDDVISSVVRGVSVAGAESADEFRRGLGVAETDTLRLFAMRRTLQGRRQASLGLVSEAMDGFALLPRIVEVPWESWLKGALFVGRSLGGDLDMMESRFAEVANDASARRCEVAVDSMNRVDTLSQCQLVEVTTSYGTGFVEILVFRNTPTIGLFGAPTSLGVNEIEYRPTTNLAQLAASLADALDASGKVVTGPIGQDQLAATSFSLIIAGSYLPTAGCLSFVADGVGGSGSFSVFVAELLDDADIDDLADAATTDEQAAVFADRRLILLCAQPNFDPGADTDDGADDVDFHDVEDLARTALRDPATASWMPH